MDIHDHLYTQIDAAHSFLAEVWQPQGVAVVIGHGQSAEQEVHLSACRRDGVEVIRRRGGGGAVVLMPGVLCLSCAFISQKSDSPYYFFQEINTFLIGLLRQQFGIEKARPAGISDIALDEKKILGCSMFKSRSLYFYQGSLLVNPALSLIDTYLSHPSREPDYRGRRSHGDFVTSLWQSGHPVDIVGLTHTLEISLPDLQSKLT
jgi:lipoate-protein ligase A